MTTLVLASASSFVGSIWFALLLGTAGFGGGFFLGWKFAKKG